MLCTPISVHMGAVQHASSLHVRAPAQLTVQSLPPHVIFLSHVWLPVHSMSHVLAWQSTPAPHAKEPSHDRRQLLPPQVMGPLHESDSSQWISHCDACEQSMAPSH